jgi:hypothetical protein
MTGRTFAGSRLISADDRITSNNGTSSWNVRLGPQAAMGGSGSMRPASRKASQKKELASADELTQ